MQQTIMIVEDDPMIRNLIKVYLIKQGYQVVEAKDGEEAKTIYYEHYPCLIILDLMLPKVSGEEFYQWLQAERQLEISVIMLSAKSRIDDKIIGLNLGADAYMTKPFDPNELVAQVEAVLRRTNHFCQKIVHAGLCLMPRKGEALLHEKQVNLTKYEFDLLEYFMRHPNVVLSREQLMNVIYDIAEGDVMERTIDAHIKKLREKIEENRSKPRRIITVRGMGYKFVTA